MRVSHFVYIGHEFITENLVFNFQKELLEYYESGVKLLKEGCLTFKQLFEKETKFNP